MLRGFVLDHNPLTQKKKSMSLKTVPDETVKIILIIRCLYHNPWIFINLCDEMADYTWSAFRVDGSTETWRAMLVPLFELRTYVSFFSPWGSIFMIEKQSERATDRHMVFQTWEFGSPCSPPNKVSWSF